MFFSQAPGVSSLRKKHVVPTEAGGVRAAEVRSVPSGMFSAGKTGITN